MPQLLTLDFERVDQVDGPIAVAGAEPGDTLQIDLLAFQPADWGWTAIIPGFGLLADEFPKPAYHVTKLGPTGAIEFMPGIRLPRAPFCGGIGVAPARRARCRRSRPTSTAGTWTPATSSRARRCTCRSSSPGARFSIGDGHADAGRRRGLRHGDRDADARDASG